MCWIVWIALQWSEQINCNNKFAITICSDSVSALTSVSRQDLFSEVLWTDSRSLMCPGERERIVTSWMPAAVKPQRRRRPLRVEVYVAQLGLRIDNRSQVEALFSQQKYEQVFGLCGGQRIWDHTKFPFVLIQQLLWWLNEKLGPTTDCDVRFCWVSGHVGVDGSE